MKKAIFLLGIVRIKSNRGRQRMKKLLSICLVLFVLSLAALSHADTIVTTGEPNYAYFFYNIPIMFNTNDSTVAAQFTLNTRYSITALQGKILMNDIGTVVAAIYAADGIEDSGTNMPGTLLFTRSVQYDDTNFIQLDWHGPTGITDTYLDAGTYWISFYTTDTDAWMGSWWSGASVPNRLVEAFSDQQQPSDIWWAAILNLGVRIEGVQVSIPEPSIVLLLMAGIFGLVGLRIRLGL
jgi:hypothetical protein